MSGPSVAWVESVEAIGRMAGVKPLPSEMVTVENDDWKLTINLTNKQQCDLAPYDVLIEGKKYFAFGILAPSGGMVGGMSEDQLIDEMRHVDGSVVG